MFVPSSDRTWFIFNDEAGDEYMFFDNGECEEARNLFFSLMPNSADHPFVDTNLYVEYKNVEIEFLNKDTGEYEPRSVNVLSKVEEL